jgi:DNA-binding Xre family transcriptional regulator
MSPISIALLKAREAAGLTQVQLAKKAKVRQATISEMEGGKTVRLNLDVLDRLCSVLDVEPGDLLERQKRTKRGKK